MLAGLAGQMGVQLPAIYQYGKSLNEVRRIWTSLTNDVSMFVFTFGLVVMVAHFIV
jgi:hypothetical protein